MIAAPVFATTVRTIECRISRQSHEESIAPSGTVAQFIEDINHRHCVALFAIGGGLLHTDYTGRNNADQPSTGANTYRSVNDLGCSNRYQYDPVLRPTLTTEPTASATRARSTSSPTPSKVADRPSSPYPPAATRTPTLTPSPVVPSASPTSAIATKTPTQPSPRNRDASNSTFDGN